jgi:hypothetical protein
MTNVMYAMRRETWPSVQREDTEDIAFQTEMYSREETLRGGWLDSFLEAHKSTQRLQDTILILRTLSEVHVSHYLYYGGIGSNTWVTGGVGVEG